MVDEGGVHGSAGEDHAGEDHAAAEGAQGSVSVIDMQTDEVVRTFSHESLVVPHFVGFRDRSAYIPNIGGNHITVVDLDSFSISDVLVLEGAAEAGACSGDRPESGGEAAPRRGALHDRTRPLTTPPLRPTLAALSLCASRAAR